MAEKLLLQVKELGKVFGKKIIFENAECNIVEKQKIGVIGRNGAGKTTFFKMLIGDMEQDVGDITKMPGLRLGYIPQQDPFTPDEVVIEFLQRYTGKPEWECAKVASQFQLKNEKITCQIGDLSGGYQMRVKLAATLLFEPNLLLLDEPTNYLDLSTLILLERFLLGFKGAFLVITHDREFLKKTCTSTLDVENGKLIMHPEPLEDYLEFKQEQKELASKVNINIERKQKQLQTFVDKFGAKASKAKSAQSKLKQIGKLDEHKISIVNPFSNVRMHIPDVDKKQDTVLECKKLSVGYENKTIISEIDIRIERGKKVAILGDNGQGKSTLLKTLAGDLKTVDGEMKWKSGLKFAYYHQHVNLAMDPDQTVVGYVKKASKGVSSEDQIYRMLGNFLFSKNDYLKEIKVLSGGEKARLCLAGMFLTKADVYLLDEPTNHLDFETVEAMGQALGKFSGTVFVVSHNRTFVSLIASEIIEVKDRKVKRVLGTYEDYVWQLEEDAKNNFLQESSEPRIQNNSSGATSSVVSSNQTATAGSNGPQKELSKEDRKKLYELKKDLEKADRKIQTIKKQLEDETKSASEVEKLTQELGICEDKWLEIQTKVEALG